MAHKFAFAPIIGNGISEPYAPGLTGCDYRRLGPVKPDGHPRFMWDLVILKDTPNSNPDNVIGDNILVFPIVPNMATMTVGEIGSTKRQEISGWLTANGYDNSWITGATLVREIFVDVLQYLTGRTVTKVNIRNWIKRLGGLNPNG